MTTPPSHSRWRIALWSVTLGLIFALPSGIIVEGSSTAGVNQPGPVTTLGTSFDPASALAGFLVGAAAGALVGTLWYVPRYGRATAVVLLTALGGLAGLVAVALVGAQTIIVVSGNSVSAYHGAAPGVLVAGFAVGAAATALALWGVLSYARHPRSGPAVAA